MNEIDRLDDQLRRSFEGEAWHGPSVLELVEDVKPEEAYAHPVPAAHSIWELVLHLTGTYGIVLRRLRGDGTQITPSEDWPAVASAAQSEWQDALSSLRRANEELRKAVLSFVSAKLDEPLVPEPPYTAYTQFIGITQHDLYHAGQIALLKKALRSAD